MKKVLSTLVVIASIFGLVSCSGGPKIAEGKVIELNYKGTLANGQVFDTTENKAPLKYLAGAGQLLPQFEAQVAGLSAGAKKTFTLKAAEAYGDYDETKVRVEDRDGKFKGVELQEGAIITANSKLKDGRLVSVPVRVLKLTKKEATLDYNHPLAGQDLTFDVEVVSIADAPEQTAAPQAN